MLYDVSFLKEGAQFPPRSEIKRLDAYRVNSLLLDDEPWVALPEYKTRVISILMNFSLSSDAVYLYSSNYWSDLVEKTKELIYGEPPEFTGIEGEPINADLLSTTEFFEKVKEGCADFVALGDWVTKIIEQDNVKTFINVDPSTWFPVVSRENVKDVKAHVLAWVAEVGKNKYELHAQIHEKGKYTNKAFAINNYSPDAEYTDPNTKQKIKYPTYEIGRELKESKTDFVLDEFQTGLDDFAVIASANNPGTRRICGASDFDKITDAQMEYNVRMTLKNVVLDKHSAPKLCGPPFVGGDDTAIGNYLEIPTGATPPNYLTWDASMQAVLSTITELKDDISNLSGMGSLLNSKTFGESQGYDALMIKLAPALMRSAGKKETLAKHLKRLIAALSGSYGQAISEKVVSVLWHDGIPTTESVRADIARKHLDTGWSVLDVLMKDYGWTEEAALKAIEQKRAEAPAMPMFGFTENEGGDPV